MNALLDPANSSFIGHLPSASLANLRAPLFLPWNVSFFLFESHWFYWIVFLALGAIILIVGYRRNQRVASNLGRTVLILVAVWILAAGAVDTPRERLDAVHDQIFKAAESADARTINSVLANDFHFGETNRQTMAANIEATLALIRIKSNARPFYQVNQVGPDAAESQVHVWTDFETTGLASGAVPPGKIYTEWRLQWIDVPGKDWQLHAVTSAVYGAPPDNLFPIPPSLKP